MRAQYGSTAYHLIGTARMGPASDPTAVVDDQLRVHGMQGLRVVDASIMPNMPSANTYATTMMIAEKAVGHDPRPSAAGTGGRDCRLITVSFEPFRHSRAKPALAKALGDAHM